MSRTTTDMDNASHVELNDSIETTFLRNSSIPEPPRYILVIASVFYSITFIAGIISNLSVVVVVVFAKRIRSRMSALFANLGIADMMVILVCMPSAAIDLFAKEVWYLGEFMCKLVPFVEHLVSLATVLTILAITYDRYRGICFPLNSQCFWTKLQVKSVIIALWALAVTASIPVAFIANFKDSHFVDGTPIKVCRMPINSLWKKVYIVGLFSVFFLFVLFILLFFVTHMCRKLIWHVRFLERQADKESDKMASGRRRVIYMLILVITTFFLCLLPQRIFGIWLIFVNPSKVYELGLEGYLNLITFTRVMLYISSASNPIIYNIMSKKFRHAIKEMIPCGCHTETEQNSLELMKLVTFVSVQLSPARRRGKGSVKFSTPKSDDILPVKIKIIRGSETKTSSF